MGRNSGAITRSITPIGKDIDMKSRIAGCAALMIAASGLYGAARAADSNADVLGVRLGAQPDAAVKLAKAIGKDMTVQSYRLAVTAGPYATKPILFGASVDGHGNQATIEDIDLIFSTAPGVGLDYVSRVVDYRESPQKITLAATRQALIAKYGTPTYLEDWMKPSIWLFWKVGAPAVATKKLNTNSAEGICTGHLNPKQYGGSMTGQPEQDAGALEQTKSCGTWLSVVISNDGMPNAMVTDLTFVLADFTKLSGSYGYLQKLVNDTAAAQSGAASRKAQTNRPQL